MIYFIQDPNDGTIKIGRAIQVARRLKQLEAEYETKLNLLGVRAGHRHMERCLHSMFHALRCPRTEWFNPGKKLLEHIAQQAHAWTPEDDIDEEYDQEIGMAVSGEALQWAKRLCEHVDPGVDFYKSYIPNLEKAWVVYAEHVGFKDPRPSESEDRNRRFPPLSPDPNFTYSDDESVEESQPDTVVEESLLEVHDDRPRKCFVFEGGWG